MRSIHISEYYTQFGPFILVPPSYADPFALAPFPRILTAGFRLSFRFPMLSELACRGQNVFGCFTEELPRKRYFSQDEEFAREQLDDIKDIRHWLQDAIFAESRMKKEIKLMCSQPAPPPETLKVWRTVIVLLGLKGDEVLNTDQHVAWEQIRLARRPTRNSLFTRKNRAPSHLRAAWSANPWPHTLPPRHTLSPRSTRYARILTRGRACPPPGTCSPTSAPSRSEC